VRAIDLTSNGFSDSSATRDRARDSTSSAFERPKDHRWIPRLLRARPFRFTKQLVTLHPRMSVCYPSFGLDFVLLVVLLALLWSDCMARPARVTSRTQRHSTSTIAIVIKTSSVGGTHSIGIAGQRSVGQMTRSGASPSVLSIARISRPVKISPQTRQYRFSSRECHRRN